MTKIELLIIIILDCFIKDLISLMNKDGVTREKMWNEYKELTKEDKKIKVLNIVKMLSSKGYPCEKTQNYIENNKDVSEEYLDKVYCLIMKTLAIKNDERNQEKNKLTLEEIKKLEELSEIQQKKDEAEAEKLLESIF